MHFEIVKVLIRRDTNPTNSSMVYPDRYIATEVDACGIGPTGVNGSASYSGHMARGGDVEWCFIMLPYDLAYEYAEDPDMDVVTPEHADECMERWCRERGDSEDIVRDRERVLAINTKLLAGIELTQEDKDALDPESPIRGINKRLVKCETLQECKYSEEDNNERSLHIR